MSKRKENQFNDLVLWIGKPLFKPYLLNQIARYESTIKIVFIGLILTLFINVWYKTAIDWSNFIFFILFLFVGVVIQIVLKIFGYRNTKYWITQDALYIQEGAIKPKVICIQKSTIIFINIEKTSTEQKENAGTVIIDDGELKMQDSEVYKVYKKMVAIPNPEDAIRFL